MNKKFVTLFPECGNYGIVKDVGMIPNAINCIDGWDGILASSQINLEGQYINDFKDLKYKILQRKGSSTINGFLYLLKNARKIDVLNVYHFKRRNTIWFIIYKLLNPKGITYVKMDMGFEALNLYKNNKRIRERVKVLYKYSDIVSVESTIFQCEMQKLFSRKIIYIPNGYLPYVTKKHTKENIIFTAGRLGTEQKATEILLEAFKISYQVHNYNLYLAGSVEDSFKGYIDAYFKEVPELRKRVIFLGDIKNRIQLMEFYEKSKIFIMTSRWEGFPLVLPEALSHGCYLLLTDAIAPANDLIKSENDGLIMQTDDISDISNAIQKAVRICDIKIDFEGIKKKSSIYEWKQICEKLIEEINNVGK